MKKKLVIAIAVLLGLVYMIIGNPVVAYNNRELKKAVTAIDENIDTVTLEQVVPFKWDKVYTFDPYASKEEIAEIIGFNSPSIKETVSEGMVQLLFVKGNRVAASVCAYPDALGYTIHFFDPITYGEEALFTIKRENGIISLILSTL